jgi:Asp-tRNA(Asn)/Glu-tRNA(Gln) amidotransferase A subunit family amidase
MMIIGRRFEDATVLQVSAAFERERGEFPRPS